MSIAISANAIIGIKIKESQLFDSNDKPIAGYDTANYMFHNYSVIEFLPEGGDPENFIVLSQAEIDYCPFGTGVWEQSKLPTQLEIDAFVDLMKSNGLLSEGNFGLWAITECR
jgi:hypothetical protein